MDIIEQTLNDQPGEGSGAGSQFVCLDSLVCVGVALGVFIQAKFLPYVCDVQSSVVKVGIMGVMGNKGGCSIRFQFFRNSLCFVSSHLATSPTATPYPGNLIIPGILFTAQSRDGSQRKWRAHAEEAWGPR